MAVDKEKYFTESKKAIQVVLENEKWERKRLSIDDKLRILKEHKDATKSPDEFDELEEEEKRLKRTKRFFGEKELAVPDEHRDKIKRNAEIEQAEVDQKLDELKSKLPGYIDMMEKEVLPLLEDIRDLTGEKLIPYQIDMLTKAYSYDERGYSSPHNLIKLFNKSSAEGNVKKAVNRGKGMTNTMRKLSVESKTTGKGRKAK